MEIDGRTVLIDPFWSDRASPTAWIGPKRWYPPPISLSQLPAIDAVIISHDHYDHLDYATVVALKSTRTVFVVPLGVGEHLSAWGIPDARIVELDWWQSTKIGDVAFFATPARHSSGRISTSSNQTLWAGYAIIGPKHRVWYSGDTGFHSDLAKIGERWGPFDLTLIDAGQYNAFWPDNHMGPELAVEAHLLVRGNALLPVHWGLLTLGNHVWTEPVERVLVSAKNRGAEVLTPKPGESIEPTLGVKTNRWWPNLRWRTANEDPVRSTRNGAPGERFELGP